MFELMQQMKQCIQNNPNEARQMLLQNPQLAYALLQALVVMRVVDPNNALSMLQKGPGQTDVGMGTQHVTNHGQLPWVLDHKGRGLEIVLSLVFQNINDLATLKTNELCIATSRPGYGFAPHRSTDGKR